MRTLPSLWSSVLREVDPFKEKEQRDQLGGLVSICTKEKSDTLKDASVKANFTAEPTVGCVPQNTRYDSAAGAAPSDFNVSFDVHVCRVHAHSTKNMQKTNRSRSG